jgi:hypothetical protein
LKTIYKIFPAPSPIISINLFLNLNHRKRTTQREIIPSLLSVAERKYRYLGYPLLSLLSTHSPAPSSIFSLPSSMPSNSLHPRPRLCRRRRRRCRTTPIKSKAPRRSPHNLLRQRRSLRQNNHAWGSRPRTRGPQGPRHRPDGELPLFFLIRILIKNNPRAPRRRCPYTHGSGVDGELSFLFFVDVLTGVPFVYGHDDREVRDGCREGYHAGSRGISPYAYGPRVDRELSFLLFIHISLIYRNY